MSKDDDAVKLANALIATGMVPAIILGPRRWTWALEKARALIEKMQQQEQGRPVPPHGSGCVTA